MADESMLIESSLGEPQSYDEQTDTGGEQPTAGEQVAPEASASGVTEGNGNNKATDFEKRFKDTQTALNEQRTSNAKMQGQLEILMKQSTPQHTVAQKSQEEMSAEHEALIEKVREDPSALLDHVYDLLQSRDAYMEDQIHGLAGNVTRLNPEFIENQSAVNGLRENPALSNLSDGQLLAIVKMTKETQGHSKPVMTPQGSLSGSRNTAPLSKPISPEEKYQSFMVAAGVAKPNGTKKGILTLEDG